MIFKSMEVVYIILTVLFAGLIFTHKGISRFLIFIIGITFLPYGFYLAENISSARVLNVAFWMSVIVSNEDRKRLLSIPCKYAVFFLLFSFILTGFFDGRFNFVVGTLKGLLVFFETFGYMLLGYISFCESKERQFVACLKRLSFIVCVYAFLCIMLGSDPLNAAIGFSDSFADDRNRVASFYYNSHIAGLAESICLLILLYVKLKYKTKLFDDILIVLLVIALFMTKSRSALLDFMAGASVLYYLFIAKSKTKVKYILIAFIVLVVLYMLFGSMIESKFGDAFLDDGGKTGGSNVVMRMQQLYYSYQLFLKNPLFGNGFNYFWDVIAAENGFLSSMLMGAESYVFILLIERGLIQIVANIVFFTCIYRYMFRQKCLESYLAIAMLTAFLVNSIVTGNLYKWPFAMLYIGFYLGFLQIKMEK